jgi:hypothetical protein
MNNLNFWAFFESEAYPNLANRQQSLRYVFEYLDKLKRPVFIVETGCVRNVGTWAGEGQSTILFDKFVSELPGSVMHTVDLEPKATALCKTLVSQNVNVNTGDSVSFFRTLSKSLPMGFSHADVLYLDSYDVDFNNPHLSAMHHVKELLAAAPLIGPETLVVIDDAPLEANFIPADGGMAFVTQPVVGGKGKYVGEYARNIGLTPVFSGYQVGWIGF